MNVIHVVGSYVTKIQIVFDGFSSFIVYKKRDNLPRGMFEILAEQ
jgi:hypothetical protein